MALVISLSNSKDKGQVKTAYSIKRRLAIWTSCAFAVLLAAQGSILNQLLSERAHAEFDLRLEGKARGLIALIEFENGEVVIERPEASQIDDSDAQRALFQVRLLDGSTVLRSSLLNESNLPMTQSSERAAQFSNIMLPDGRDGRMVSITFAPIIDDDVLAQSDLNEERLRSFLQVPVTVISVAIEREALEQTLLYIKLVLLGTALVTLLLVVLVVLLLVRLGLRPIADIRAQLEKLDPKQLQMRIQAREPTLELDILVAQMNDLMSRLELSFNNERRFSADVAHELRTPISELRSTAEVALRFPADEKTTQAFFVDVLGSAKQLEHLVVNLLALARGESAAIALAPSAVDVHELIEQSWQRLQAQASARGLSLDNGVPKGCRVQIDLECLSMIVHNLLENAVSYADENSLMHCYVSMNKEQMQLIFSNVASQLREEDLPKMLARLWRKDKARSDGRHSGLGLTIVGNYAELLGLQLHLTLEANDILIVQLNGFVACDPQAVPES